MQLEGEMSVLAEAVQDNSEDDDSSDDDTRSEPSRTAMIIIV